MNDKSRNYVVLKVILVNLITYHTVLRMFKQTTAKNYVINNISRIQIPTCRIYLVS